MGGKAPPARVLGEPDTVPAFRQAPHRAVTAALKMSLPDLQILFSLPQGSPRPPENGILLLPGAPPSFPKPRSGGGAWRVEEPGIQSPGGAACSFRFSLAFPSSSWTVQCSAQVSPQGLFSGRGGKEKLKGEQCLGGDFIKTLLGRVGLTTQITQVPACLRALGNCLLLFSH